MKFSLKSLLIFVAVSAMVLVVFGYSYNAWRKATVEGIAIERQDLNR